MKKTEIQKILLARVAQELFLAPDDYKSFLKQHEVRDVTNYYELLNSVKLINIKVVKKMLPECEFDIAKLYLTQDELQLFYMKIFDYLFLEKLNSRGVSVLLKIERRCKLNSKILFDYRETRIKAKYSRKVDLNAFTKAILSYFFICIGNDGHVDKDELAKFKEIIKFCDYKFNFPLKVFDLGDSVLNLNLSKNQKTTLVNELEGLALCDGAFQASEQHFINRISKIRELESDEGELSNCLDLIIKLGLIMSDGVLDVEEKKYFTKEVSKYGFLKTINDGFIFKLLMYKNKKMYLSESKFFDLFWNTSNIHYNVVEKLFNVFANKYLSSSDDSLGKIVKEDVLLFLSLVTSKDLSAAKFNKLIRKEYVESMYKSLKFENTDLDYFFIASSMLIDKKMTGSEYEIIWSKLADNKINFPKLERAINDYSLLKCEEYEIDVYFDYLREVNT